MPTISSGFSAAAQENISSGEKKENIIKALCIAGTHSGVGKTTVALGLMAALVRRGLTAAPFKVGPDFIDPSLHARIAGRPGRTLDGWMLSKEYNEAVFARHSADADVAVIEGVMGLFDGASGNSDDGSTAQIARWLDIPVLLVVDAEAMARSAAALVQGFEAFDPALRFAGVVFNRIGGGGHLSILQEALESVAAVACIGGVAGDPKIEIPERHLGLTMPFDHPLDEQTIGRLAALAEENLDIDGLLADLPDHPEKKEPAKLPRHPESAEDRVRIAVAHDAAFCFYYPDNFDLLSSAGAELVFFSPLEDEAIPPGASGLYLGGGYPELHASRLSENRNMRCAVEAASRQGMPIHAECGGFMYLCRSIEDAAGTAAPMCGCFPFRVKMNPKMAALGYRRVRLLEDGPIGTAGTAVRGHEFRYSSLMDDSAEVGRIYRVSDGAGQEKEEGFAVANTLGSYIHLHFGSCPEAAEWFVHACRRFRNG